MTTSPNGRTNRILQREVEPAAINLMAIHRRRELFQMMDRLFSRRPSLQAREAGSGVGRILVVSTPRSGNTWLRRLLAKVYGLDVVPLGELAAHTPDEFPWKELPGQCVLQLHWEPDEPFLRLLREHRVRAITLARHPLDVLVSILQYSQHDEDTAFWLRGDGGDETPIRGVSPCSEAFLSYATSQRATKLLSVSLDWWQPRLSLRLRYEDLVRDTPHGLDRLTQRLGRVPPDVLNRSIEECSMGRQRTPDNAPHFWQGTPGLWRKLFTAEAARCIAAAQSRSFRQLGYRCDPDPELTREQADANWARLAGTMLPSKRYAAFGSATLRRSMRLSQAKL